MKQPISLKKLILEAQQTTLIEDDSDDRVYDRALQLDVELADAFREYCRNEFSMRTPNIRTSKQVEAWKEKDPDNFDDVKVYFEMNDIYRSFVQNGNSEYGYPAYVKAGGKVENAELKKEMDRTLDLNHIGDDGSLSWWWYILALCVVGLAIAKLAIFRKAIKFIGSAVARKREARQATAKALNANTVQQIEEGKLFVWMEQQQKAALAGSKQKMPKWAYDDVAEQLAREEVRREVREMVMGVCLGKIKNGTMNAETFIAKLPSNMKTPANVARIKAFAAEAKAAKAMEKAKRKPRPKI